MDMGMASQQSQEQTDGEDEHRKLLQERRLMLEAADQLGEQLFHSGLPKPGSASKDEPFKRGQV
jgi:hypothetical protein